MAEARGNDTARVARHVMNVLARAPDPFYAFVYEITEGCDDTGRWIVDMELLAKDWWDRAWPDIAARGGAALAALLGGSEFEDVLSRATPSQLALMYDVHLAFMMRMIDRADPADVGLYHVVMNPTQWERDNLRVGGWYLVQLSSGAGYAAVADYGAAPERNGVFSRHELDARDDPPPDLRRLQALDPPKPPLAALLPALHWPHPTPDKRAADPQPPTGPRAGPSGASSPTPTRPGPAVAARAALNVAALRRWFTTHLSTPLADTLSTWKADLLRWLEDLGPPPALAFAGAGASGSSLSSRPTLRSPATPHGSRPMQYTGAPLAAPLGPQVANPMLPGGGPHQPLVGVLNVGQGNLNALYDDNGRVLAYYDFGSPVHNHIGTAPAPMFAPCLHDDPIIIISHWDYDHIGMARRHPNARYMRWVVPQQRMGAVSARGVYASILANGLVYIWPGVMGAPPRQHIPMPWGYLERGLRNNQLGVAAQSLNHGGLVMYVCVCDAAAPVVAPGRPVIAAPFVGRAAPPHLAAATLGANNTDAMVTMLLQHAQITAAAAALASCEIDVGNGLAAPSVPAAEVGRTAEVATLALASGVAGWLNILQIMGIPLIGPITGTTGAAAALHGAFTGGLAAHVGPSASASLTAAATAAPVAVAALAGGGITHAHLVAAAAVVDATIAAGGGLAAAATAAHACAFALSVSAGVMLPGIGDPIAGAAGLASAAWLPPNSVIAGSRPVARSTMGAGASAASLAGAAPAFTATEAILAACLAVVAGPGWNNALIAMTLLGNPIGVGAGALQPVLAAIGGATAAAAVGGAGGAAAAVAGGPIAIATVAAAAACADAAQALAGGLGLSIVTAHADAAASAVLADAGIVMPVVPAPLPPPPAYGGAGPILPPLVGPAVDLLATGVIQPGTAPYDLNERYVHLTGDVGFHYMPSQNLLFLGPPASPVSVGLLPSHHGAFTTLNEGTLAERLLAKCLVPWAPGTAAAHAAAAAGAATGVLFGVSPRSIAQTVAAAAAYAAGVVARGAAVPNPNVAVPFATIANIADGATEAGYPAATTWDQVLMAIAHPAGAIPAAAGLTAAACRFVPVLVAIGPLATLAATVAAGGPMGPGHDLRRAPSMIEMVVCFALADAALAAIAAAAAYPGPSPPAVLGAAYAVTVHLGAMMPPPTMGALLAGATAGAAAIAGGAAAQHAAYAVGVMSTDLAAIVGMPPVLPAQIAAAAIAAVAAAGGGWHAMIDAMWAPGSVLATGGVGVAAAALSRPLAAVLPPPAAAFAAFAAMIGALPPPGPTPQELAAVAAAIDAAIAVQQLPAGGAGAPAAAADAAWNAASAVATATGVAMPARRQIFPGALVLPRFDVATATVEAAVRPFFAAVGAGGPLAAAAIHAQLLSTAHAQAVVTLPESGKILYSYGIDPTTGAHPYPSQPGPPGHALRGHPHPHAAAIYEGHGWTSRLNTSATSNNSNQPEPFPGPGALAGGDHLAMGWEVALPYVGPLQGDAATPGVVTRGACLLCGASQFSC